MPKRQKQSKELAGEGRPAAINLGDFLLAQTQIQSKQPASPVPSQQEDFPALTAPAPPAWVRPPPQQDPPSPDLPTTSVTSDEKKSELPYKITKTKKGTIPIRVENRNKGKKVTVVFNVSGDSRELLKELKHSAGCGGVIREDTIELQGEKISVVEKLIKSKMGWR